MLQQVLQIPLSFKWLQGAEYLDKLTLRFPTRPLLHQSVYAPGECLFGTFRYLSSISQVV